MKKVTCIFLTIVTLLMFSAAPAVATTYYASDPVYVTTSDPNDTVTQSEILWGVAGTHNATITSATVKLQLKDGDQVSVNWCDSSGDTIDTSSVNTGSSTVSLSPPSGAYGALLELDSGSESGSRWAWWYSVTNSQGNTTIFPDPDTNGSGGSGGETPVDLGPVVDELQVIQYQITNVQNKMDNVVSQLSTISSQIDSATSEISGKLDDISGQLTTITGQLTTIQGQLDDIESDIEDIYDYISTPRLSQPLTTNLPNITFDPTPPAVTEPQQQPYLYNRPTQQMPSFIDSPGPLPISPDPVTMEHEPAAIVAQPRLADQPVTLDPVTKEEPRTTNPVTVEEPRTQDPVARETPRITESPIQMNEPITRDNPITPDAPLVPDQPR